MKYTFCEYAEKRQKLDSIFESIVLEAEGNDQLMRILSEAGFWDSGVGKFANNLWQAGTKMVKGAWNQGGIQSGAKAAWSQMTGPATQVNYAITALKKALNGLENDKNSNWQNSQTTGQTGRLPSMKLMDWLRETIQELESQEKQFSNKELPSPTAAAPQTTAAQPATDVVQGTATSKF